MSSSAENGLYVTLAVICGFVGPLALAYLIKHRRWWLFYFLLIAYIAILYIIYAIFIAGAGTIFILSAAATSPPADPIFIFAAIAFAYAIMALITAVVTHVIKFDQRNEAGVFLPAFLIGLALIAAITYADGPFVLFGAAATTGLMTAATLLAIVRRPFGWGRSKSGIGSDTFSHLLYWGSLIGLFLGSLSCNSQPAFGGSLFLSFLSACAATTGAVYEVD
jgi:hypothetical protein